MPFGLRNAAQTFQRTINEVTRGFNFVFAYLDDLLIAGSSSPEHEAHLRTLFQRLDDYSLVTNPYKCLFGVATIEFLGHLVIPQGIRPLASKVKAIQHFPPPTSLKRLRIPGITELSSPLSSEVCQFPKASDRPTGCQKRSGCTT